MQMLTDRTGLHRVTQPSSRWLACPLHIAVPSALRRRGQKHCIVHGTFMIQSCTCRPQATNDDATHSHPGVLMPYTKHIPVMKLLIQSFVKSVSSCV